LIQLPQTRVELRPFEIASGGKLLNDLSGYRVLKHGVSVRVIFTTTDKSWRDLSVNYVCAPLSEIFQQISDVPIS